jgi:hypothetical protein
MIHHAALLLNASRREMAATRYHGAYFLRLGQWMGTTRHEPFGSR